MFSRWDGGKKGKTKDCADKCDWFFKISGRQLCLWGVAWKELYQTENPRHCDLLSGERKSPNLEKNPREDAKIIIENLRRGATYELLNEEKKEGYPGLKDLLKKTDRLLVGIGRKDKTMWAEPLIEKRLNLLKEAVAGTVDAEGCRTVFDEKEIDTITRIKQAGAQDDTIKKYLDPIFNMHFEDLKRGSVK